MVKKLINAKYIIAALGILILAVLYLSSTRQFVKSQPASSSEKTIDGTIPLEKPPFVK